MAHSTETLNPPQSAGESGLHVRRQFWVDPDDAGDLGCVSFRVQGGV